MTAPLRDLYERVERSTGEDDDEIRWQRAQIEQLGGDLRVLDVGCGDGRVTAASVIATRRGGVVGVDVALNALVHARESGLTVVSAGLDGSALPFRSAMFDVVLLNQVIEHLVDTDGLIREVRRVLVPGGVFLLSTPNLAAWFNRILLFGGVQPIFSEVSSVGVFGRPGRQIVGHLRLFTRRALAEFLTAHGFVDLAFAGGTYHDVPRGMKWLDRLAVHRPGLAANLLVRAISPGLD